MGHNDSPPTTTTDRARETRGAAKRIQSPTSLHSQPHRLGRAHVSEWDDRWPVGCSRSADQPLPVRLPSLPMSAPAPMSGASGSTLAAPSAANGSVGSRPSSAGGAGMLPLANPFVEFESLGVIGRGKYSEVHKVSRNDNCCRCTDALGSRHE